MKNDEMSLSYNAGAVIAVVGGSFLSTLLGNHEKARLSPQFVGNRVREHSDLPFATEKIA